MSLEFDNIDRIGVAVARPVPDEVTDGYMSWIASGRNGDMGYLDKYHDVRRDPRLLLPGARSVISCAIGYYHLERQPDGVPSIASYAHGDDYHDVVRKILSGAAARVESVYGGTTRVCVDTAPIHERYWAVASGVAYRGKSGLVIVPGLGTYCFLGEIITTAEIEPTLPLTTDICAGCGQCRNLCPGKAIESDGTVDARKCLSYLTIEYRGELPVGVDLGDRLYGCDTCQQVCPHNALLEETTRQEFMLRPAYRNLTRERIAVMTAGEYAELFRHSAVKRAKLAMLQRNIARLGED